MGKTKHNNGGMTFKPKKLKLQSKYVRYEQWGGGKMRQLTADVKLIGKDTV